MPLVFGSNCINSGKPEKLYPFKMISFVTLNTHNTHEQMIQILEGFYHRGMNE